MKTKRRRRYKKKKYDLFLISKIALICYLAIFGVGYITSDTSAYYSSQSEISQIITAGIWEVTDNACGQLDGEDEEGTSGKDGTSDVEDETECGEKEELPKETDEKDIIGDIACNGDSSKKDCKGIDEPKEEKEIDKVTEKAETIEQKTDTPNELEENSEAEKENENKTPPNEQPNSPDEDQKQPDSNNESESDSQEKDEALVTEENSKKEGDTNEI